MTQGNRNIKLLFLVAGLVSSLISSIPVTPILSQTVSPNSPLRVNINQQVFLPVLTNASSVSQPTKQWTGMHLGNRNFADWTLDMLAPFDPTLSQTGVWPRVVVVQSRQVFSVFRYPSNNCKINSGQLFITNVNIYNYLRRASMSGNTAVVFRITPSPGNFVESTNDAWLNPETRPYGRTLLTGIGQHPSGWSLCDSNGNINDGRFRPPDDIGDEMIAIQSQAYTDGWSVFGFEPANEPNVEWYGPYGSAPTWPSPSYLDVSSWLYLDTYFSNLYDYVAQNQGNLIVRVLTPPMAQNANAEAVDVIHCSQNQISGYYYMSSVFNTYAPKSDLYSWHNYFTQAHETYTECPNGNHVSIAFPQIMHENLMYGSRLGLITETDLAPPEFNDWNNNIKDKDTYSEATVNAERDFLRYEANANGGARSLAVWLLNDDCNSAGEPCAQHQWSQAYKSNGSFFRNWFNSWWFGNEY